MSSPGLERSIKEGNKILYIFNTTYESLVHAQKDLRKGQKS